MLAYLKQHFTHPGCNLGFATLAPSILGNPVVLDRLCRNWSIHQLRKGYRFNGDDILLASEAFRAKPNATNLLDLGCGTGSVGLLWLARAQAQAQQAQQAQAEGLKLTALEAQEESVELLQRTVGWGLELDG